MALGKWKVTRQAVALLVLCWLLAGSQAMAQHQFSNWYFGERASFTFLTNPVSVLYQGIPDLLYDSSCVSDSAGTLQFIASGYNIWDRNMQLMPGGDLASPTMVGYEVMAVPQPGHPGRYYVFVPRNWFRNSNPSTPPPLERPNLTYFIVDMRQRGGLGTVVARDSVLALPITPNVKTMFGGSANIGGYVQSEIAAVRHANGRDQWLIVKNDQQQYLSFLLDQHGVHAQPVVTPNPLGRVFRGSGRALLKASTDGRTLASSHFILLFPRDASGITRRLYYTEVARFDARSGRVASSYVIPDSASFRASSGNVFGVGGLEFSPDGTRLYCDTLRGREIWQYDLAAGSPAAVAASRTTVAAGASLANQGGGAGNLQLGPDGRIYQVGSRARWLSRFETPNAKGLNSAFQDSVLEFIDRTYAYNGLPKAPNDLGMNSVSATGPGSISVGAQCAGEPVQFTSSQSPFVSGAVYSWNFGDLASGTLNTGTGQAPAHIYQQSGAYTVTLNISGPNGQQYSTFKVVYIQPGPVVSFGAPRYLICPGQSVSLIPGAQPSGTSYRWQDGSRQPTLLARQPGTYMVSITNTNGCTAQASTQVDFLPAPKAFLGKDTTICLEQPYLLRVRNTLPVGTTYRWQDGFTGVSYLVQAPGQYAVELTASSGCVDRASITIRNGNCEVVLPNIITPNGDPSNEFFVLKNLKAAEWSLTVFNRWGRQVFQQARYANGWNAAGQPAGTYYYQLRSPATGQVYKGVVEVVR